MIGLTQTYANLEVFEGGAASHDYFCPHSVIPKNG